MNLRRGVIGILGFGIIALTSCEKVIDIPLNEAEQTLVVEAIIKDDPLDNYVKLSKTGTVYDESDFEEIEEATVTIRDSDGGVFVMSHQGDGLYSNTELQVQPGLEYYLEVQTYDRLVASSCQTRSKPKIDSLTYENLAGQFGISTEDTIYLMSFHAVDHPDERNFYWMKIFRNGRENSGYYLGNDDFINGQSFEAQFFGIGARPKDTVLVEMISMDEANYDYFIGLSNNLSDNPFAAAPANPPSNLVGEAIGFFGAYTTDTLSLIVP